MDDVIRVSRLKITAGYFPIVCVLDFAPYFATICRMFVLFEVILSWNWNMDPTRACQVRNSIHACVL